MKPAIRSALLATFLGALSVVASARAVDEPASRTVNFADLDLTRAAGVAVLYARIRSAAQEVCGQPDTRQLQAVMEWRRCTEQAIGRAVHDAKAPGLTGFYRTKLPVAITVARR